MRKILPVITFILAIWQCTYSYSKDIVFPNVRHTSQNNIFIKKITILSAHTQVDFLYKSNESNSRYIYLSLPKDGNDSMYLKVKNMKYKLLFTNGIANKDGQTVLLANATNNTGKAVDITLLDIKLLDEQGNEIVTVGGIISPMQVGETTQLNASMTMDYANAYDVEITLKK